MTIRAWERDEGEGLGRVGEEWVTVLVLDCRSTLSACTCVQVCECAQGRKEGMRDVEDDLV